MQLRDASAALSSFVLQTSAQPVETVPTCLVFVANPSHPPEAGMRTAYATSQTIRLSVRLTLLLLLADYPETLITI